MVVIPSARCFAAFVPAPARPMERSASGGDRRCGGHGQHVAPEPAQVGAHHGHRRPGGHGGVGRRAAPGQHGESRRRRQLIGSRHHAALTGPRSEGREGECHASGIPRHPEQRRSGHRSDSTVDTLGSDVSGLRCRARERCVRPSRRTASMSERRGSWPRRSRRKRLAATSRRRRRLRRRRRRKEGAEFPAQGCQEGFPLARSEHGRKEQARRQGVCVPQRTEGAPGRRQARQECRGPVRPGRGRDRQGARPGLAAHQNGGEEIRRGYQGEELARAVLGGKATKKR